MNADLDHKSSPFGSNRNDCGTSDYILDNDDLSKAGLDYQAPFGPTRHVTEFCEKIFFANS
jgi:hypothetical protein